MIQKACNSSQCSLIPLSEIAASYIGQLTVSHSLFLCSLTTSLPNLCNLSVLSAVPSSVLMRCSLTTQALFEEAEGNGTVKLESPVYIILFWAYWCVKEVCRPAYANSNAAEQANLSQRKGRDTQCSSIITKTSSLGSFTRRTTNSRVFQIRSRFCRPLIFFHSRLI